MVEGGVNIYISGKEINRFSIRVKVYLYEVCIYYILFMDFFITL